MAVGSAFTLLLCYLAVSQAWNCSEPERFFQIYKLDAGNGLVVGTRSRGQIYVLNKNSWSYLKGNNLRQASVGPAGIWGTDRSSNVYKFIGGSMVKIQGPSLQHVDVGGIVVGVSTDSTQSYCLPYSEARSANGVDSVTWKELNKELTYISCEPEFGCWGIGRDTKIYVAEGVSQTCEIDETGWKQVSGPQLFSIDVGDDGNVFGLGVDGTVYERLGISDHNRSGDRWSEVPFCCPVQSVTYDSKTLWLVTETTFVVHCTK